MWLDIETAAGVRLGLGPITTATGWTVTPRLDRAGDFAFTMPAADARADLLQPKRTVRCWDIVNGAPTPIGAGRIEEISLTVTDGATMLSVSGVDLLGELIDRHVDNLALTTEIEGHPANAFTIPQSNTVTDGVVDELTGKLNLRQCYDFALRDTTTYESFDYAALSAVDANRVYVYVCHVHAFHKVRFTIVGDTWVPYWPDPIDVTMGGEYWNNESETWDTLTITSDGTDDNPLPNAGVRRTFAQTGDVEFELPAGWGVAATDSAYKARFFVATGHVMSTVGNYVDISDITVTYTGPTQTALADIMALAPAGWSLDAAQGYTSTASATELGDDLVINGGFEAGSGDTFTGWDQSTSGGHLIEETTTCHAGARAVKVTTDGGTAGSPLLYQQITVAADSDYILTFSTRGDGTRQGAFAVQDLTNVGSSLVNITCPTDTGITGTDWTQYTAYFTTPAACTEIYLLLYGPAHDYPGTVYYDSVTLKRRLGGEVYLELAGETILEALGRVMEQTGEHLILSPSGRQVLALRADARPASVRIIGNAAPLAVEDHPEVALIKTIEEIQRGYELASRVYPYGGGQGAARETLADCTRTAPDGYTLDKAAGCLIRTATETNIGRFDKRLDCPDINAQNTSQSQREFAANALFDRAYVWLVRHSAASADRLTGDIPRAYKLTITKCDRILLPGQVVRVVYHEWRDGYHSVAIDADLWILSATTQVDATGLRTTALEVANVDTWPLTTDAELIYRLLQAQRAGRSHAAAESGFNSAATGTIAGLDVRDGKITRVRRT